MNGSDWGEKPPKGRAQQPSPHSYVLARLAAAAVHDHLACEQVVPVKSNVTALSQMHQSAIKPHQSIKQGVAPVGVLPPHRRLEALTILTSLSSLCWWSRWRLAELHCLTESLHLTSLFAKLAFQVVEPFRQGWGRVIWETLFVQLAEPEA